jgi:hypothetical protein
MAFKNQLKETENASVFYVPAPCVDDGDDDALDLVKDLPTGLLQGWHLGSLWGSLTGLPPCWL